MVFKPISDRSDRRCDKSDRREAFLRKNHAKLTYFHLIFPSFQYYAALIYTWNPVYVEYKSDVINKAAALPPNWIMLEEGSDYVVKMTCLCK